MTEAGNTHAGPIGGRPGADTDHKTSPTLRAGGAVSLTEKDFVEIGALMYRRYGIDLRRGKEGLVAARLGKKLREGGFSSFRAYFDYVTSESGGEALIEMVDALTTNHTGFLRERQHFDFLVGSAVPELATGGEMHIWSAACATGEEPYSIACTLLSGGLPESPGPAYTRFRILATDLSTRALQKARAAVYPEERFREFPPAWRGAFLLKGTGDFAGQLRFKPEVTRSINFRRLNLMEPFPNDKFHVIFCRNVMMYFDRSTQEDVVARLAACLEPGGYLLTGHSETLTGIRHDLAYVRPAIYRKAVGLGELPRTSSLELFGPQRSSGRGGFG